MNLIQIYAMALTAAAQTRSLDPNTFLHRSIGPESTLVRSALALWTLAQGCHKDPNIRSQEKQRHRIVCGNLMLLEAF